MVVDSSALIAVLQKEPEGGTFLDRIERASIRLMSAATLVEVSMVALGRRGEEGLAVLQTIIAGAQIEIVPLTERHAELAVDAFRRFGRGRHPAGLNMGDCFAYALSKATGEPLLFKGEDFALTDVGR
jgi:ribonuclease VapC